MTRGKKVCKILKEIRQQIADKNDIEYITSECHFHGECKGTCPKCEAEVRYLENELHKRSQLGKAASIAGISLGIASTFAACNTPQQQANTTTSEQEIRTEMTDVVELEGAVEPDVVELEGLVMPSIKIDDDDDDSIWETFAVKVQPDYPGGMEALYKFLQENLVYPKEAKEKGINGKVYLQFVVERDGSISNIKVAKGIGGGCDEEAVRVISMMPNWKPGKENGKEVRVNYILPIHFNLDDK